MEISVPSLTELHFSPTPKGNNLYPSTLLALRATIAASVTSLTHLKLRLESDGDDVERKLAQSRKWGGGEARVQCDVRSAHKSGCETEAGEVRGVQCDKVRDRGPRCAAVATESAGRRTDSSRSLGE